MPQCYEKAGLGADWESVVLEVSEGNYRKTGFVPGFEDVVNGTEPSDKPPLLESAKVRWDSKEGPSGPAPR